MSTTVVGLTSDADILNEAKMLREHKNKLESRMKILEDHNSQLCGQLGKLKHFLQEVNTNKSKLCLCLKQPLSSAFQRSISHDQKRFKVVRAIF